MSNCLSTHNCTTGHLKIKLYKNDHVYTLRSSPDATENNDISDFGTNAVNIVIFCSTGIISTFINKMDTSKANIYPFYFFVYFYDFIFPPLITSTIALVYYLRHPPLRKTIYRELRTYYYSMLPK